MMIFKNEGKSIVEILWNKGALLFAGSLLLKILAEY